MSIVKFINETIWICFSASTFKFNVDQCYPSFTGHRIFGKCFH